MFTQQVYLPVLIMPEILGINDPQILIGYGLAIGFAVVCIVYGLWNWNSGGSE